MALIALVATKGGSPSQRKMCDRARRYLDEQKVPYEVVDAKVGEASPDELSSEALSYPQFFLQYGNGEITHLGGLDEIKHLLPVLSVGVDSAKTPKLPQEPSELTQNPTEKQVGSRFAAENVTKEGSSKGQDHSHVETVPLQPKGVAAKRSKPRKLFRMQETKHGDAVLRSKHTDSCRKEDGKIFNDTAAAKGVKSATRATRTSISNEKSPLSSEAKEEMIVKTSVPGNLSGNASPSVTRWVSHKHEPPLTVVRVFNCDTYQRPDRTRGNSFDDDHSSISDSYSWADRDVQRSPSLRPSFTRGYSFDNEQSDLLGSNQDGPRPLVSKEFTGKVKAKRHAYVRSISFDESSFDESNHSRREIISAARTRSLAVSSTNPLIRSIASEACNQEPNNTGNTNDPSRIDVARMKTFDENTKFTISPGPSWLYSKDDQMQKTIPLIVKPEQQPVPRIEPVDSEKCKVKIDAPDKKSIVFDGKTTFSIAAGPDWLYS